MYNSKDLFEHIEYKLNIYKDYDVENINEQTELSDVLDGCLSIEEDIQMMKKIVKQKILELRDKEYEVYSNEI